MRYRIMSDTCGFPLYFQGTDNEGQPLWTPTKSRAWLFDESTAFEFLVLEGVTVEREFEQVPNSLP
jgi:hypothetical protein